jgi:5-formyltetrahydrofolate cyclo-ligase
MTVAAEKADLRARMRAILNGLPPELVAQGTARILGFLRGEPDRWLAGARAVTLFGGIKGEPDLLPLVPWLVQRGLQPVFFACGDDGLVPHAVADADQLRRGPFGIHEPGPAAVPVPFAALDVVLTPGLAFGRDGSRLGRGKAYYDGLFARPEVRARRLGVGFACQHVPSVPCEPHDARVQEFLTEEGWRGVDRDGGGNA